MKRVLVITYYWPPSGGAGVQRWLKFTKYLPEFGWQPVVYTPENPEAPVDDPSLEEDIGAVTEVVRRRIWEPYTLYKKFVGMDTADRINAGFLNESEKPEKKEGFSVWIRGNLFIPDARKFWIRPSARFLMKYLSKHPVDAVISTGPPHSMHLIAIRLKRSLEIPWLADFRDPWTEIDFYNQLRLTSGSDRKHRALEKAVLETADRVVVIGKTMAERFRETHAIQPVVIPNGYDEADFAPVPDSSKPGSPGQPEERGFTLVHIGAMNRDRNHPIFWEAVKELKSEKPALLSTLKIKLVGKLDVSVLQSIREHGLQEQVETVAYLPHDRIVPLLRSASVLYLPINHTPNARSIQTGKLFEYLAAGRPILGSGPVDGDAAGIIRENQAGIMVDFADKEGMKKAIGSWAEAWQSGNLKVDPKDRERYSRKNLAASVAGELNGMMGSAGSLDPAE